MHFTVSEVVCPRCLYSAVQCLVWAVKLSSVPKLYIYTVQCSAVLGLRCTTVYCIVQCSLSFWIKVYLSKFGAAKKETLEMNQICRNVGPGSPIFPRRWLSGLHSWADADVLVARPPYMALDCLDTLIKCRQLLRISGNISVVAHFWLREWETNNTVSIQAKVTPCQPVGAHSPLVWLDQTLEIQVLIMDKPFRVFPLPCSLEH